MYCRQCGAQIPAADVNVQTMMARCTACGEVFSFASQAPAPEPRAKSPAVPRPERIEVDERTQTLSWRWYSPVFFFLLAFCIAWDAFLIFWYLNVTRGPGAFAIIACIFPIAHVAVGIGLTYFTIAGFVNRTVVQVTGRTLDVSHGPLPWRGTRHLDRTRINQVYCDEKVSTSTDDHGHRHTSRSYAVRARLTDNSALELVSLSTPQEARFIEQTLERWLGVADQRVAGELPRT